MERFFLSVQTFRQNSLTVHRFIRIFASSFRKKESDLCNNPYAMGYYCGTPEIITNDNPSYLGSSKEDIIIPSLFDMHNYDDNFAVIDLSNMLTEPVRDAHGIVWKILVNGKDAQDEYEDMLPLGVVAISSRSITTAR